MKKFIPIMILSLLMLTSCKGGQTPDSGSVPESTTAAETTTAPETTSADETEETTAETTEKNTEKASYKTTAETTATTSENKKASDGIATTKKSDSDTGIVIEDDSELPAMGGDSDSGTNNSSGDSNNDQAEPVIPGNDEPIELPLIPIN